MKISDIARKINATPIPLPEMEINWLLTDSRSLSFPTGTLFFALKTSRNDGHKYIPELYRQNVRCFVVSKALPNSAEMPNAFFLQVDNTLDALQLLVAEYRKNFQIPIIGITGSNGKTVVKEWLNQLLNKDFKVVRSPKSYNSQIGVPLSVWSLKQSTELGIFEAGISTVREMERLQPIISPTIGIYTNLGDAHSEGFKSQKQKCEEKLKLFAQANVLIYNSDDKLVDITIAQAQLPATLFSWGKNPDASVQILNVHKNDCTTISLQHANNSFDVSIPFTDDASIENSMQCICTMLYLNYPVDEIVKRMQKLEQVAMRLEVKDGINHCIIINDTYNSDINSLEIALNLFSRQATKKKLPKTLILSDIQQSGYDKIELYKMVAKLIKSKKIDQLIGVGKEILSMADYFSLEKKHFFKHTDELLKSSLLRSLHNEIILLKGAREFRFETILQRLELTVHETTLDVDLNALISNFNYFRSKLRPETKTVAMVKAFAYGSGSIEVAGMLQNNHCNYLAVAVADEGAELRRAGIRIPIMVMNPEKAALENIIEHELEPEIYSFRLLELFLAKVEKLAVTDYPIHIKIDTGMHRLGFEEKDLPTLIERLKTQNQLKVRSVFSHLAGADGAEFDDFTKSQVAKFERCANQFTTAFSHKILRHILNSAGIERFPQYQFDMVRVGIGLYEVSALPDVALDTVCTLRTVVLQIRDVKAGDTVGYSRKGKIDRDSRIGIIPIGYADGFDRRLSNGVGEVWINGKRAKIVGNICMDSCMIDLTDIDAKEGDKVEVFGKNIPIQEVAQNLNTIPYEILTGVSRRVKRVYFIN